MSGRRLALAVLPLLALCCAAAPAHAGPYSSHAQMYSCCTNPAAEEGMFREAKESGAAYIRVDINLPAIFFPERYGAPRGVLDLILNPAPQQRRPDWSGTDRIARLSHQYRLPVLAVLLGSPQPAPRCPARIDRQQLCPPADTNGWGSQVGQVAARYRGAFSAYEIWNEPDGRWAFGGEPDDYAHMLSAAYGRIKRGAPAAKVVLGGTMFPDERGTAWLNRMFATPGTGAAQRFDIGSIHLRGNTTDMVADLRRRRSLFARWGHSVPIWVTEHGYPSSPSWQRDAFYRGGERAQADYLAESLPTLALAAAQQVFVTLRDSGAGSFGSEGILRGSGPPGGTFDRKPAWVVVRDAAAHWPLRRFRRRFVSSRAIARKPKGRSRYRITIRGRFRGPACGGRIRLTFKRRRASLVTRAVKARRSCRYRRVVTLALRSRHSGLRIGQQFLGNSRVGPGAARTLRVKFRR